MQNNMVMHFYMQEQKQKIRRYENDIHQMRNRIEDMNKRIAYYKEDNKPTTMLEQQIMRLEKEIQYKEVQIKKLKRMCI